MREPDIDENGVDLAQIRAMLDLTPAERLSKMASFMNALIEIRALNGNRRSVLPVLRATLAETLRRS